MKTTCLIVVVTLLLLPSVMAAQQKCAYTYSWTKSPSLSFCVTQYGTIGSIQSPIGTEHLNAANPVEGFEYIINDAQGGTATDAQVPGAGYIGDPNPTFSEPKGPGKLPLVVNYEGGFAFGVIESINANAKDRTISVTITIKDCGRDCEWEGIVARVAQPNLDGQVTSNFGASEFAALAYEKHGLALSLPFPYCTGVLSGAIPDDLYFGDDCNGAVFTGSGAVLALAEFTTNRTHQAAMTFTYRVF